MPSMKKLLIVAEFTSMQRAQGARVLGFARMRQPNALRQATADSELVIVQGV